jgi:CRISPR/Cas system CSM-associated protein Csm2 small subunit
MEEEYKRALEVEREKEEQRWEESVRYQEELEKQLTEKEKRKQHAYEEFLKEKLMIDEIVRKIYEEDERLAFILFLFF